MKFKTKMRTAEFSRLAPACESQAANSMRHTEGTR